MDNTESAKAKRTQLHIDFLARLFFSLGLILLTSLSAAQDTSDWQLQIRERVAAKNLSGALAIAERRLEEASNDLEARGWRARLLAWSNRWKEAEAEYRLVLEAVPADTDILMGLADVLTWQQRHQEALALLDRAHELQPTLIEIHTRRGRVLRALGRRDDARAAFREALSIDPADEDAHAGLESLKAELRHELRFGADFDFFNFAEDAGAFTTSLRSKLNSKWTTHFSGAYYQRFSQEAGKFTGSATYHFTPHDAFTAGGSAGDDNGIIPKGESFFEYGHGFRVSSHAALRGVEVGYRQRWLWFRDARIVVLTPNVTLYFAREWMWSFNIAAARSRFSSTDPEWGPSGWMRLTFPVTRRVTGSVFYGVGTENFARADQLGRFSARTWGGDIRVRLQRGQEFGGFLFFQDRSQGRNQTSLGFTYALRF